MCWLSTCFKFSARVLAVDETDARGILSRKAVNHFEFVAPMPMNAPKLRGQYVQSAESSNGSVVVTRPNRIVTVIRKIITKRLISQLKYEDHI